ncbi:YfmQ family protein [Psychrobacillus sp. NPDC093180]|uniref:YfmQ family protein n=1 Tax=Psychrobacillus sp. NPDC093180 TaxID=3364489 RepID=UPI0037F59C6B
MIWTIITIIVLGTILIFVSCPPSALVGWVLDKFALHPKLDSKDITITFNGTHLDEEEKIRFNEYFNEAHFLERNHIFPGNEKFFLNPETDVIPFVINVRNRIKETNFFIYSHDDNIDVVKQWKKKVASYSLSSEYLHNFTISTNINEKA